MLDIMDSHVDLFQSLADSTRLRLLNLLLQAREICVCEFVDALKLTQYNISRHLQLLKQARFVEDRKFGKWVYYGIAKELKAYQRTLLRAISEMRDERQDFHADEARASRRLNLRRDGLCCVGLVTSIGAASLHERAGGNLKKPPRPVTPPNRTRN
jgi:ArsR family transcriptional regulator